MLAKRLICITLLLIACFSLPVFSQPKIQSFSPGASKPGSQVTITGSQFNNNAASNIVYVGGVKAAVLSAASTVLIIEVPAGAGYGPLSVTVNGLTAYSSVAFTPTFPGVEPIDNNTLGFDQNLETGFYPRQTALADLNLDGKPDMLVLQYLPNNVQPNFIQVFQNATVSQSVSFAQPLSFPCGIFATDMAIADFDGDGKIDVAASSIGSNEIAVLRNNSSANQINFEAKAIYSMGDAVYHIATADIDGDGKPDLVATNYLAGTVSLLRNQSIVGNISFVNVPAFNAGLFPGMIVLTDLNGDAKPDIVLVNELSKQFTIFQNNSTTGNFSFGNATFFTIPDNLETKNIATADFDADGKNDLLITTSDNTLSVGNGWIYRNTSTTGGNISVVNTGKLPNSGIVNPFFTPAVGDVNGDGSLDVMVGWAGGASEIAVYQNQSAAGTISFALKTSLYSTSPNQISIGDLNADGKPELVAANVTNSNVSIFRNKAGALSITNVTPSTAGKGSVVTINGKNFLGAAVVSFGGVAATSFTVISNTEIKAVVSTGATGEVKVTGTNGSDSWLTFHYYNEPLIDSVLPNMGFPGDTITIRGQNLLHTFYVKFNGINAAWFTVIDATTVKATAPSTGVTGTLTLETPGGFYNGGPFIFLQKPVITSFLPAAAAEGQYVYISGQHLATPGFTPQITIGGVPVTYIYDNGNQTFMTVIVGAGASGQIKVSHFGGADSIAGFTFIAPPSITSFSPAGAFPADTVIIKGRYFRDVSGLFFGDSAATFFVVINDSTIKAVVSHGRSGNIKVVQPSGTATIPSFVFKPFPAPVIQSFFPLKAIAGTTLTIKGQFLWGVLAAKIGNTPVRFFEQITPGELTVIIPIGATGAISVTTYYGTVVLTQPVFERITPPVITNVTPLNGKPGDPLTITGTGFGSNSADVIVYLGQVKAMITALQDNKITISIPASAVYAPITVTVKNLTVSSPKKFNPTNPATENNNLGLNSFKEISEPGNTSYSPVSTIALDLNGDGKPDFVTVDYRGTIEFYVNTSSVGKPYWEMKNGIVLYKFVNRVETADIDGNGKTDLIFFSNSGPKLGFALNNSTPDSIDFTYDETAVPEDGLLADINGDGKTDIISINKNTFQPVFLLNNSIPGKISFKDTLFNAGNTLPEWGLAHLEDLDNDGLIDLVGIRDTYNAIVFRNTGTKNSPSFNDAPVSYSLGGYYYPVKIFSADLNGDGLLDLLVAHSAYATSSFAIYKNLSTPGNIKFGAAQLISNIQISGNLSVADFNGDNKLDVLVDGSPFFHVFQNNSTADSIILGDKISFLGPGTSFVLTDMDGDNKTDILSFNNYNRGLYNQVGAAQEIKLCPNSNITLQSNVNGTAFQWQMDSGTGFVNITNDAHFTGTNSTALTITNIPSDWLKRQFRCKINNRSFCDPYKLIFTNSWQSYASTNWHIATNWACGSVPDGNTTAIIPPGYSIELNANAICQSLILSPFSTFTVLPQIQLVITNK